MDQKKKYYKDILQAIALIDEFLGVLRFFRNIRLIVKPKALLSGNWQ
jgi:hypothetical protein